MHSARAVLISAILVLSCPSLRAAEAWIRVRSAHFELFTNDSEKQGREAILYFEQVRSFFLQASPSKKAPEFPVRVIAFKNEKQFRPYRMNEAAAAYYSRGRSRDCITMHTISEERFPLVIHEYTHMIQEHAKLRLPLWANEGMAELFSTLKPHGKQTLVGSLIPGRMYTLRESKWLDLETLGAVDHDSPHYNEKEKAGVFYAESWALMHMLCLSPEYRPGFDKFLAAINAGKPLAETLQAVYGKDPRRTFKDLEAYLRRDTFSGLLYNLKLAKSEEEAEVSPLADYDVQLAMADLLRRTRQTEQAKAELERLAKANPGRPEAEEELGYQAWEAGDQSGAAQHLIRAVKAGSTNAQACFHAGSLSRGDDAVKALERAVELKPDYTEARINLGVLLMNRTRYTEALQQLRQVKKIDEDSAFLLFFATANTSLALGDEKEARAAGELAKKWAKTPGDTARAAAILRELDRAKEAAARRAQTERLAAAEEAKEETEAAAPLPPPQEPPPPPKEQERTERAEGVIENLDCQGKRAVIRLRVGKVLQGFVISDPSGVAIRHEGGGPTFDFTCGRQKPFRMVVEYAPRADTKSGVLGAVRALEF